MARRDTRDILACDYVSKQPHWLDKEPYNITNPYEFAFPSTVNARSYVAIPDIYSVTGRGSMGLDYALIMKPLHSGTGICGKFSARTGFNFCRAGYKHLCGLPDLTEEGI